MSHDSFLEINQKSFFPYMEFFDFVSFLFTFYEFLIFYQIRYVSSHQLAPAHASSH